MCGGKTASIGADLSGRESRTNETIIPFARDGRGGNSHILRLRVHIQIDLVETVDELLGFLRLGKDPPASEVHILAIERRKAARRRAHLNCANVLDRRGLLAEMSPLHAAPTPLVF